MKSDEDFFSLLLKSYAYNYAVAEQLTRLGHCVRILPQRIRPNFTDRFDYSDDGDLEITLRIETKQKSIDFTSLADFPFEDIIIDDCAQLERKHTKKLWGFIILNASLTGYIVIPGSTYQYWFKKEIFDNRDKKKRTVFLCPKKYARFCQLESTILNRLHASKSD